MIKADFHTSRTCSRGYDRFYLSNWIGLRVASNAIVSHRFPGPGSPRGRYGSSSFDRANLLNSHIVSIIR